MKRNKQKKRPRRASRHHITPVSRGGDSSLENIAKTQKKPHQFYHALFSNKIPEEIIEYLVNDFWNGNWEYVEKAYKKYQQNIYK